MTTQTPQGAATPPTPTQEAPPAAVAVAAVAVAVAPQPPGRLAVAKARMDNFGAIITVLAGIGGVLAAGAATTGGYVTSAWDWLTSTSQTQSQVTAIDERLKVLEADKTTIAKDREELARLARSLDETARDLTKAGVDVREIQDLQRRLELRVERLDALLEILRDRRS